MVVRTKYHTDTFLFRNWRNLVCCSISPLFSVCFSPTHTHTHTHTQHAHWYSTHLINAIPFLILYSLLFSLRWNGTVSATLRRDVHAIKAKIYFSLFAIRRCISRLRFAAKANLRNFQEDERKSCWWALSVLYTCTAALATWRKMQRHHPHSG